LLAQDLQSGFDPVNLGLVPRIEQSANFLLVAFQALGQLHFCDIRFLHGEVNSSLGGHVGRDRDCMLALARFRRFRDGIIAPDSPGDGFFQAIGALADSFGDVLPLCDRFGEIAKSDDKATRLSFWRQDRRVSKALQGWPLR